MKNYITTKVIKAQEMSRNWFLKDVKNQPVTEEDQEGFYVKYPDGYESWSPKQTFLDCSRQIIDAEIELLNL